MADKLFDSWTSPLSESRNELVFANRNRSYGAYQLRRTYRNTLVLAMLVSGAVFLIVTGTPKIIDLINGPEVKKKKFKVTNVTLEAPKPLKDEPTPPPPPPPPEQEAPKVKTQKFVVPVINEEARDPEPPPVNTNIDANVSNENQEGIEDNTQSGNGDKPVETDAGPLEVVQVEAQPKGGLNKFYDYVSTHFEYPERCQSEGINGYVMLKFVVDVDGSISNVVAIEKTAECEEFTKEAIRVLLAAPKWTPAQNGGKPVKAYRRIPIRLEVALDE
jgi:protein TonB